MTNAIVLVCFLAFMAILFLTLWFRSHSGKDAAETGVLRYRVDTLQQQLDNTLSRVSQLEEKTSVVQPDTGAGRTDVEEAKAPLTVVSVRTALRMNGFSPEGPDGNPEDRQLVVFNIQDTRFHVDVTRLPFLTLELGYSLDPTEEDIDLLYKAAYEVTSGIFIGKVIILGEAQAVVFQAEMMCDSYVHLRDSFKRYLDIVIETQKRFYDTYQKLKDEKKRAVEDIMNSAFNADGKDGGERRNLS